MAPAAGELRHLSSLYSEKEKEKNRKKKRIISTGFAVPQYFKEKYQSERENKNIKTRGTDTNNPNKHDETQIKERESQIHKRFMQRLEILCVARQ